MKIVKLIQGTIEWLKWRLSGVGASESPVLLVDNHPWCTKYKLFNLKKELIEPDPVNPAMRQGIIKEPHVRDWFIQNYFPVIPICAEMEEYPFIKASLDGWSEEKDAILEIKVSQKSFELAQRGAMPEHYRYQVQHQLLVSGASKAYFVAHSPKENDFAVIEELPDEQYQEEIFNACKEFWARVQTNDPPEPTEKDELVGGTEFNLLMMKYVSLDRTIKDAKIQKERLKMQLVECHAHDKVRGERGRVFKRKQPGRIDNDKLYAACKEAGINVEDFRKEGSYHWVVKEIGEDK